MRAEIAQATIRAWESLSWEEAEENRKKANAAKTAARKAAQRERVEDNPFECATRHVSGYCLSIGVCRAHGSCLISERRRKAG